MTTMSPEFDEDGYPTDHTLQMIADWSYDDLAGMLRFAEACFDKHYGAWEHINLDTINGDGIANQPCIRIATGGWSGNESVVDAMMLNRAFVAMHWEMSARGGLFIFNLRNLDYRPNEQPHKHIGAGSPADHRPPQP